MATVKVRAIAEIHGETITPPGGELTLEREHAEKWQAIGLVKILAPSLSSSDLEDDPPERVSKKMPTTKKTPRSHG